MNLSPSHIKLLQKSRKLEISFENETFSLSCEYLRVFSLSAEMRGHGEQELRVMGGKQNINIIGIEPIGNYAIRLIFDDGHQTGIYSWNYLYELATNFENNWQNYLTKLKQAGLERG